MSAQQPSSDPFSRPRALLLAALLVAGVAAASMAPGLGGELLNWDDDRFVRDNPLIHQPSWANVAAIVSRPHFQAYHPLHLLSYIPDHQLFGLWAPGYKLHNLVLYLICLLLTWLLLRRIGLARLPCLAALLLFAAHPLHVEAVVWVTARKETLALALMLGAMLAHLRSRGWRDPWRWTSVVLYAMAMLSKTATIVLPALLLAAELLICRRRIRQALVGAAPLWVLSGGIGVYVASLWQQSEMIRPDPGVKLVLETYWHYGAKLLAPLSLSPVYPIEGTAALGPRALLGGLLLAGLGVAFWRLKQGCARLAIAWFVIALVPVCNLVPVYFFVQDRYALIPSLALAIGAGCLLQQVQAMRSPRRRIASALTLAGLLALAALFAAKSATQSSIWRSSLSLWQHAVRVSPGSYYAHLGLGHTLRKLGRARQAVAEYRRAVVLRPRFPAARISLCLADAEGRLATGSRDADRIEQALRGSWTHPGALIQLAASSLQQGHAACAVLAEQRAFELSPPGAADLVAAASRWTVAGNGGVALRYLSTVERALPREPGLRAAYQEVRAQALALVGRRSEALAALRRSLELSFRDSAALLRAADDLERRGRPELSRLYRELAR